MISLLTLLLLIAQIQLCWSLISFPLDAPPPFATAWNSLSELRSLARQLIGANGLLSNEDLYRSAMDQGLYEAIERDWKKNWNRFKKWVQEMDPSDPSLETLNPQDKSLIESEKWARIKASHLTIGLQVALDSTVSGKMRPRLFLEIDGCTRIGSKSRLDSSLTASHHLLSSISQYSPKDGIQSCDQVCPEASVAIVAEWKRSNLPTGLLVYAPRPLSTCSAAYLTLIEAFSKQSLDPAFKKLDSKPLWSDGSLVLSVGQEETLCALNLDAALSQLPIGNKNEMRSLASEDKDCEHLLSSIHPFEYVEFYKSVLMGSSSFLPNSLENTMNEEWPSAQEIIQTNAMGAPGKNHLDRSCSEWQSFIKTPTDKPIQIPRLQVQGPVVGDIYSLVHVALQIAAVNPYNEPLKNGTLWENGLFEKVSQLCKVCHMYPSVSYASLFAAFDSIQTNVCQNSVFGGLGSQVALKLDTLRRRPVSMGSRVQRRLKRLNSAEDITYYSERCKEGDILLFNHRPIKKTSDFVEEPGAFFKVRFSISSSTVSPNHSELIGSAVWSAELGSFSIKLNLEKRSLQGLYPINVFLYCDADARSTKPSAEFKLNIICGYHTEFKTSNTGIPPSPIEMTLLSFQDLTIPLQTRVPLKRHFLFYDSRRHQGVYDPTILSFLSATSAITIIDYARNLKLNDVKYPAHLKPFMSLTESCPADAYGRLSESRVVYRNDLVKVIPCLQNSLIRDPVLGSEIVEAHTFVDVFLVKAPNVNEKFLILHFRSEIPARLIAKILEHYRLNFGHQMVLTGHSLDGNFIREALVNLGTQDNYDLSDTSPSWIFPFSGQSQTARIVHQTTEASNLCISPSPWSAAQCQDVAEFSSWFRQFSQDLQDTHLPVRKEECSLDYLGSHIPVTFTIIGKKIGSINLKGLQERDILSWRNSFMAEYLASFDMILTQGISSENLSKALVQALPKSFSGHSSNNLHSFWKSDSLDVIKCLTDEYDATPIMGCIIQIEKQHVIVVNLEDDVTKYGLSNPNQDLSFDSIGIMKRIYMRLCQTRIKDCLDLPFPAVFAGTWNHAQEPKSTYSEQQRYLEVIERQIVRKNRLVDNNFLSNRTLKIYVPSETELLESVDGLLYSPDAKQNQLFDWLSGTEKILRKRWPFSSQLGKLGVGNWVLLLSDEGDTLGAEDVEFDAGLKSPQCLYGKIGRCSFTDPPCSGFKSVEGIYIKPFNIPL